MIKNALEKFDYQSKNIFAEKHLILNFFMILLILIYIYF